METSDYQSLTNETAIYPRKLAIEYCLFGLASEAGELLGHYKKFLRGDYQKALPIESLKGELGDCLWYISQLCTELNLDLGIVMQENLEKLAARAKKNTIRGSGDDR